MTACLSRLEQKIGLRIAIERRVNPPRRAIDLRANINLTLRSASNGESMQLNSNDYLEFLEVWQVVIGINPVVITEFHGYPVGKVSESGIFG